MFLILATRFIYCFSISYKIINANNDDLLNKNLKMTYSFSFIDHPEDNSTVIYYCKDGITVMEANYFKLYSINGKHYHFPLNTDNKTYSINDSTQNEKWDDYSFSRKVATISVYASTLFTKDIDYEKLGEKKCIVFKDEASKVYYDSKTFLQLRNDNSSSITDIKYEFDIITNQDITLPDLSEYTLIEN